MDGAVVIMASSAGTTLTVLLDFAKALAAAEECASGKLPAVLGAGRMLLAIASTRAAKPATLRVVSVET